MTSKLDIAAAFSFDLVALKRQAYTASQLKEEGMHAPTPTIIAAIVSASVVIFVALIAHPKSTRKPLLFRRINEVPPENLWTVWYLVWLSYLAGGAAVLHGLFPLADVGSPVIALGLGTVTLIFAGMAHHDVKLPIRPNSN